MDVALWAVCRRVLRHESGTGRLEIVVTPPFPRALLQVLPIDAAVRIELAEGIPIFRAPPHIQERIEELLEKRQSSPLDTNEAQELAQYEELDEFLSLVNRLVRNEALEAAKDMERVSAA